MTWQLLPGYGTLKVKKKRNHIDTSQEEGVSASNGTRLEGETIQSGEVEAGHRRCIIEVVRARTRTDQAVRRLLRSPDLAGSVILPKSEIKSARTHRNDHVVVETPGQSPAHGPALAELSVRDFRDLRSQREATRDAWEDALVQHFPSFLEISQFSIPYIS